MKTNFCTPLIFLAIVVSKYAADGFMVAQVRSSLSILHSDGGPVPKGRVSNIMQWLTWSDQSLRRLNDGKGGVYDRVNAVLEETDNAEDSLLVTTPEQINENTRFAVLSHGNQTDPIYNYINAAGVDVFRWPEEIYYKLPSRYSAPDGKDRSKREKVYDAAVAEDIIFIDEAVRVRYPNSTVTLRGAILWNVYDDDGTRVGQTALFDKDLVSYGDGAQ